MGWFCSRSRWRRDNQRNNAAASSGFDRFDGVGMDGIVVWHQNWDNPSNISGGTGWTYLGGSTFVPPAIFFFRPGLLFVFLVDIAGISWKYYERSAWHPTILDWYSLSGSFSSPSTAVSWDAHNADFFVKTENNLRSGFINEPAVIARGPSFRTGTRWLLLVEILVLAWGASRWQFHWISGDRILGSWPSDFFWE